MNPKIYAKVGKGRGGYVDTPSGPEDTVAKHAVAEQLPVGANGVVLPIQRIKKN